MVSYSVPRAQSHSTRTPLELACGMEEHKLIGVSSCFGPKGVLRNLLVTAARRRCFMPVPAKSVITAFTDIEQQLRSFIERVPFVPDHDHVWSPALASCLLEACSQLDSFWRAATPGRRRKDLTLPDHFERFGASVAARWVVVWGDEGRELKPFAVWYPAGTQRKAPFVAPPWWQAYNALKHDRWANIRRATFENAANAVGGLFLAIVRAPECADALVEAEWFRTRYATPYAIEKLSDGTEDPELGITMESALLSYASGSCDSHFRGCVAQYRACTHRFGRWLEQKYDTKFLSY